MNSLAEWLAYLEKLHPTAIDLGLERVWQVAQSLDLFPFNPYVITVTGTNGKGSCCMLLESILTEHGLRVGTYTSPHLIRYNERIRILQQQTADEAICDVFSQIETARGNISLTYFEFGTLTALLLFKQAALDVVILEVGMGGRLDAVNIIDADIAVISTIAIDHTEWLGKDREKIGYEKAGIMRSERPIVCGDFNPPDSLIRYAQKIGAVFFTQAKDFHFEKTVESWCWSSSLQQLSGLPLPKIELQNAATVLKVIELLNSRWAISLEAIKAGLTKVFLPGRFQILQAPVTCIFDVAHNPAAAALLAKQLQTLPKGGKTFAVCAMLTDKDQKGTVSFLLNNVDVWHIGGLEHLPRGSGASILADCLRAQGVIAVTEYKTVIQAFLAAKAKAAAGDRILVFGSFHTVAEILNTGDVLWK